MGSLSSFRVNCLNLGRRKNNRTISRTEIRILLCTRKRGINLFLLAKIKVAVSKIVVANLVRLRKVKFEVKAQLYDTGATLSAH